MKKSIYIATAVGLAVAAYQAGLPLLATVSPAGAPVMVNDRPELAYFKAVNSAGPMKDPQILFLLMAQYSNANRQEEGAVTLSQLLERYKSHLTDTQKSLYLSAIGLLRAQAAPKIGLLNRISYVNETIAMLQEADQKSGGQIFVVNWIRGVVFAQLPDIFHKKDEAKKELLWCVANAEKAPHLGWLREVYFNLGKLSLDSGEKPLANQYLQKSGYEDFNRPVVFVTPFSENHDTGHAFSPRRITEAVPGRVYVLSGFEFTEYYFIVSDNGKELIAIDAGTRPDSAKAAYEALLAYAPHLPPLTTVFITHSHWDHIGGHSYFRARNPQVKFYARSNSSEEIETEMTAPDMFGKHFFGSRFSSDTVRSFKPDVAVSSSTNLTVGGTRVQLIPVQGGETRDAMFVNLPTLSVLFAGDFIMPYLGAPFVEEGNLQGLLNAIDVVSELKPKKILHGHQPLTRIFSSPEMLTQLKECLSWLREQVLLAIKRGEDNASIQRSNLIPPGLLNGNPDTQVAYLVLREHVIDRLYDQNTGYWNADLKGVNHLSRSDYAATLVDYLKVSPQQIQRALQQLIADGKYEQAADLIESTKDRLPMSDSLSKLRREVFLRLMQKYQDSDPFKFIIYSSKIDEEVSAISSSK